MVDKDQQTWGIPKIRGTILGVPIIRITVYWVYIGDPHLGKSTTSALLRKARKGLDQIARAQVSQALTDFKAESWNRHLLRKNMIYF